MSFGTIAYVVGARPNFVKMAPVIAALEGRQAFHQVVVHTGQRESGPEVADDESTQQGAENGATSTEQAGAADDHGRDRLQVGVGRGVGAGRTGASDEDPRGDAVDQAGHGVDADQHPVDPDTGQPRVGTTSVARPTARCDRT